MLRFDLPPVCSVAYRLVAAFNAALAAIFLFSSHGWVAFLLAFGGLVRGFFSARACPSYRLAEAATRRFGLFRPINAGAKLYADRIAGVAGTLMALSWTLDLGFGAIPATAVLIFALLDFATGFCVACVLQGFFDRRRSSGTTAE
jgi:hypothetical protein